jgi:hypothetical protein
MTTAPYLQDCLNHLPEGWFGSPPEIAADMESQLALELPPGHLLEDLAVRVVAHRMGTDDILCWHIQEPRRFTVIHLTWSGGKQTDTDYPWVEADGTFDDFLAYEQKWLH